MFQPSEQFEQQLNEDHAQTYSGVLGDDRCECYDRADKHPHISAFNAQCTNKAACTLFRTNIEDNTGTRFCNHCADDAMSSGFFEYYQQ